MSSRYYNVQFRALARETDGHCLPGNQQREPVVISSHRDWQVCTDSFLLKIGRLASRQLRFWIPFRRRDDFEFHLYPENTFLRVVKWLGLQDLQLDLPELDRAYMMQGNDPAKLRSLMRFGEVKEGLLQQQGLSIEVERPHDWAAPLPRNVRRLSLQLNAKRPTLEQLLALHRLTCQLIDGLEDIGSASPAEVAIPDVIVRKVFT